MSAIPRQPGRRLAEGRTVAVVTHCDVIRPLLAHFLGFPIDNLHRLRIDTASVSVVEVHERGGVVVGVNWRPGAFGRR